MRRPAHPLCSARPDPRTPPDRQRNRLLRVLLRIGGVCALAALGTGLGLAADHALPTRSLQPQAVQGASTQAPAQASSVLAELAWMAGTWREERAGGELLEEHWDPPLGNCMTGTLRWLRGGKATMYEFLLLEETVDGLRLYVRHFSPGCVAREEQDKPLTLELAELVPGEAAFTAERDFPRRYELRRGPDGHLRVVLEGEREGRPLRMEFDYAPAGR